MSGPPDNLSASELFLELSKPEKPYRVVDFPRKNAEGKPVGQVALRILTQEDQMESAACAERFTVKLIKDRPKSDEARRGYDDIYANAAAVEILSRACRLHDNVDRPLFPSSESIRKNLLPDEVGVLFAMYLEVQSALGPIPSGMSEEEVDAWVDRLVEGGSKIPLALLTSADLMDLTFSLALRLARSRTAIGSASGPLESGSESSTSNEPPKDPPAPVETPAA